METKTFLYYMSCAHQMAADDLRASVCGPSDSAIAQDSKRIRMVMVAAQEHDAMATAFRKLERK